MKSAITVCLVTEASSGPFVFHGGLLEGCRRAAQLGFDAIEIFPPSAEEVDARLLADLLAEHGLALAAVGTGAGWLKHRWTLTHENAESRGAAIRFIQKIIDLAGTFGAPAILGSMQGRSEGHVSRDQALQWLAEACHSLGEYAQHAYGVPLLIEPLNRYETNLFNRLSDVDDWIVKSDIANVRILADLFHMNIEEVDLEKALLKADKRIGHVHFADSNRQAIGFGHTNMDSLFATLQKIGYAGYLSAEVFPLPDAHTAAEQTMQSFRRLTGTCAK